MMPVPRGAEADCTHAARCGLLLRMGDNCLILGQRLSEWCGHAPTIEEDIALANVALDLIGQARMWLGLAGKAEGQGRSADDLAMLRDVREFRNFLLVEQPNGDFATTIIRQFLFDSWHLPMLEAMCTSGEQTVADTAAKALQEVRYHLERSEGLVVALGDGTAESHTRMQRAIDHLWPYRAEMSASSGHECMLAAHAIAPDPAGLQEAWDAQVMAVLQRATLDPPQRGTAHAAGHYGQCHSEHLGHLLAQMQWLQRAYPGARW